jgi:peroxiredoxin
MSMQKIASLALILTLAASALAVPPTVVPRKAPEFTIHEPSGKTTLLSSFKGKVVLIEFLFVRSQHCLRVVQTMNKLNKELGARGFQSIAIAFGPNSDGAVITHLVDYFKLTYPVGYTSADKVDSFLGREGNEILKIPQMVVIDRSGMIRAMSGTKGDPKLEAENSLRPLLDGLLKESPPVNSPPKTSSDSRNTPH